MPGSTVSEAPSIGWFGKLPCAGDFAYRRLPYPLMGALDNWLQQGLGQLRATHPAAWRGIYLASPMWNCAVPASMTPGRTTLVGLLAPSRDRVGREFPLCAGIALPEGMSPAPLLSASDDWLLTLGRVVTMALTRPTTVDAFDTAIQAIRTPDFAPKGSVAGGADDILACLNEGSADVRTVPLPLAHALPWPELPREFDSAGPTSYWWTNTSTGGPLRGFTTDAGFAPSLMLTLMRPQFAAMPKPR